MASRGCLCWGLAIFSPRAGGLTYHTQVGVAPSRPEMGVVQLHQVGVSPLTNSSAGGDEYVHGAGIPSEKALVRGAEGQSRMESPWCSHPCSYCGFSCSSCRRWGPWPIPPWPAAPNTEELGRRPRGFSFCLLLSGQGFLVHRTIETRHAPRTQ